MDYLITVLFAQVHNQTDPGCTKAREDFHRRTQKKNLKRFMGLNGPPMAYQPSNTPGAMPAQPQVATEPNKDAFFQGVQSVRAVAEAKHLTKIEVAQGEAAIDNLLKDGSRLSEDEATFAELVENCKPEDAFRLGVMAAVVAFYHPRLVGLIVSSYNDNVWDQVPTLLKKKEQGRTAEHARENLIQRLNQLVSPSTSMPSTRTAYSE